MGSIVLGAFSSEREHRRFVGVSSFWRKASDVSLGKSPNALYQEDESIFSQG